MKDYLTQKEDKINYLKGIIRIAKADGIISEEEKEYFNAVAVGLNMDEKAVSEIKDAWDTKDDISLKFTSKVTAVFFIQDAIQIAMVDEQYDEIERQEIRKIATELSLEEGVVEKIEEWIDEGISWRKRGENLVEELGKE